MCGTFKIVSAVQSRGAIMHAEDGKALEALVSRPRAVLGMRALSAEFSPIDHKHSGNAINLLAEYLDSQDKVTLATRPKRSLFHSGY